MKAHPLIPYIVEKRLAIPTHLYYFHGFCFCTTPFLASTSTPSANELANDLILVQTVQLKPMIKAQISGRMVSSGISDVAFASVHSEKPSEEVDENDDYYYYNRKTIY